MRRPALASIVAVLVASLASVPAPATGSGYRAGPFIRDAAGRAVFFHGVNAVWKRAPYSPPSTLFGDPLSGSYFDERDAQFLAGSGLTSVRLGVLWAGVEPQRDVFDEAYLDRMEQIVDLLGAHGVTVLVDFHQDMYHERFQGEGFPAWATHTELVEGQPATAPPDDMARFGFPGNYFTPPVMRAFDNLWTDHDGLVGEFAEFWRHVAARFAGKPNLVGYDLLNEPWPGTQWPTCANPAGCPAFDALFLQPFFEAAIAAIREVDTDSIVWWEPNVTNDFGAANGVGLLHPVEDPALNTGVSFHTYCLIGGLVPGISRADDPECPYGEDLTMQRQEEAAARNGSARFLTEFGASDDLVDIGRVADLADRYMVSWHYWHYGSWSDPTGNPQDEGMFTDDLDRPGSLKQDKADVLIRPYPQAVAGTPSPWHFDLASKVFTFGYEADASIAAPTEIFVPVARHYPGGYAVSVTGPATVTSPAGAAVLTLQNTGSGSVDVVVGNA